MATIAYEDTVPSVTTVQPFRRPRVRESGEGEPLFRFETTDALVRVNVTHRFITATQLQTLKDWLDTVTDADTVTIEAIDGETYEGRFVDRLYSVQAERGPYLRASIQLAGNPQ